MRIVIVGGGRMGFSLAEQLGGEGHQVVLVDRDPVPVQRAKDRLDVLAVQGSGLHLRQLDGADVTGYDLLIAATGSDEVNLLTCLLARDLGIFRQIARVHSPDLARDLRRADRRSLGVDLLVHPERVAVERLVTMVRSPGTSESAEFADGRLVMRAMLVEPGCPIAKVPLSRKAEVFSDPFLVAAVKRDEELIVPRGDARIAVGDTMYAVLKAEHLDRFLDTFCMHRRRTARVLVFGASELGLDLCAELEEFISDLVLLDPDPVRCSAAAERLTRTSVVRGSPLDEALLEDLRAEGADYFLGVSSSDEQNLTGALAAKRAGVRTTIMVTGQPEHVALYEPVTQVDSIVCPIVLSVGAILSSVRGGRVLTLVKIAGLRGEALEVEVQPGCSLDGRPLRDVRFPPGSVLAAVSSSGDHFLPDGATVPRAGDRVVVVSLNDSVEDALALFAAGEGAPATP